MSSNLTLSSRLTPDQRKENAKSVRVLRSVSSPRDCGGVKVLTGNLKNTSRKTVRHAAEKPRIASFHNPYSGVEALQLSGQVGD